MHQIRIKSEQMRFGKDIALNVTASFVCTATLNLIVYPLFAKNFASEVYGTILTALGVVNILFSSIGNSLNNIRLLTNRTAGEANKDNPYNVLVIVSAIVGALVGVGIIQSIFPVSFVTTILVAITLLVGIVRAYYVVTFRLQINFVKQLLSNVMVAFGYLCGILLVRKTVSLWPLPFFLGESISLIYVYRNSELFHEGFFGKKDNDGIIKSFVVLMASNLLANTLVYLDRFIINPILGAASVSIFSVASFWGKCFAPFIAPIATVILSYLSKAETEISLKRYNRLFFITMLPIALACIVGVFIAPFVTKLLYPTLIDEAKPYIILASTGALIGCATNLVLPMIMSVCSVSDLFILQAIQLVVYFLLAYVGASIRGMYGFCYAIILISIIKVTMNYCLGRHRIKRREIMTNDNDKERIE